MPTNIYTILIIAFIIGSVFVNSLSGLYMLKMIYYSIAMVGMVALTIGHFHSQRKS